jgi:hypothetical protein
VVNKEGMYATFHENVRQELAKRLSQNWLDNYASGPFPNIDEFEIEEGLSVQTATHDQNERHGRINLRQLGAWIDTQKHNFKK